MYRTVRPYSTYSTVFWLLCFSISIEVSTNEVSISTVAISINF